MPAACGAAPKLRDAAMQPIGRRLLFCARTKVANRVRICAIDALANAHFGLPLVIGLTLDC
ncbi:MAG: hypothetical protein ABI575_10250 [Oxalobacteraceae bacterium]